MARSNFRTTLAVAGALIVGAAGGTAFTAAADNRRAAAFEQLDFFADVYEKIHAYYVTEVDDVEVMQAAVQGMLKSLDRHSGYLDPENFTSMQEANRGEFGGLGIEVIMEDGFIRVVAPIEETPAYEAGLLPNDLISHVDGETLEGLGQAEAIAKLKGAPGTDVTVTILREGVDPFDVTITRDVITVHPVRAEARGDVGWIRIRSFSERTTDELQDAVRDLTAEIGDPTGFVIDVRNNPGGLLDQAVSVTDVFLADGEIVSTRGRRPGEIARYHASRGDLTGDRPVVVLINGGSASASEILAGALQDRGRATLVGDKSFGKGSVQTILPIRSGAGGAIRITTAKYYTPSGRSIHEKGIEPDVAVTLFDEGEEIRRDFRFGDEDDRQLARAVEIVKEIAAGERYAAAE